ncbi:MAG: fibronectin type III domain-containing protein, partial [Clostridia bacterium]|nr:fibronectin type III domain-containing protein [Clostridia bacterium]
FCKSMTNAKVVKVGSATELVLQYFPNFGSFYVEDNKHPSIRGSYLQALCIYSAIFDESYIGKSYTSTLTKYNALTLQRAAAATMCSEPEEALLTNEAVRTLNATLIDEKTAKLSWNEPLVGIVEGYNIYRKKQGSKYQLIETISAENCEYTDATLESGYKYAYKIKAVQTVGDLTFLTSYSSVAVVETLPIPNIELTSTKKGKITVKIAEVKGASEYEIQYSKGNTKTTIRVS